MAKQKTISRTKATRKRVNPKEENRIWSEEYAKEINETTAGDEIATSMTTYTSYVLIERALSYIDGLKPAHRRILWTMQKRGYKSNAAYTKSATVAGAVMELHPHGSTYNVIANLTRPKGNDAIPFACYLNLCLIDGHGNFGASYGDSAAADRYTEVRLSKTGESCTEDIAENAVFMVPSHDGRTIEPEIMPVRIPLLFINGSKGFTHGYNTSWLPHNPSEAIEACLYRLAHPKCSVDDIRGIMPGPDFSCGGIIVDADEQGIAAGYGTGFGTVVVTSRYRIEPGNRGKHSIIFTEAPYRVKSSSDDGKSILDGIKAFAEKHPEYGILDQKDLSEGTCEIEVIVKSGIDADMVARVLLNPSSGSRLTVKLEYRQCAVVNDWVTSDIPDANGIEGKLRMSNIHPADISVLEYIDRFLEFRRACITNACRYRRDEALRRKHLLDGLLAALLDIDEVIAVVRSSNNKEIAAKKLKKAFKLDDEQVNYILSLTLSRLTRSDRIKLEGESKDLAALAKKMDKILGSKAGINGEVKRCLEEELKKQTLPRRSSIVDARGKVVVRADEHTTTEVKNLANIVLGKSITNNSGDPSAVDAAIVSNGNTIAEKTSGAPCCISVYDNGKIQRGTKTPSKRKHMSISLGDVSSTVMLVFVDGESERVPAYEVSEKEELFGKRAAGVVPADAKHCIIVTRNGKIKCLNMDTLTKAAVCPAINLDAGDEVLYAAAYDETKRLLMVSAGAMLLAVDVSTIPAQGRTSGGVRGMMFRDAGDKVICAALAGDDDFVATSTGVSVKRSKSSDYPTKGRGGYGIRCHTMRKGEDGLKAAAIGANVMALDGRKEVEIPISKRDSSGTLTVNNAKFVC